MNQAFTYIMVKVKNATSKGFSEVRVGGVLNLSFPDSKTRRGRVIDGGDTSPTLDTDCEVGVIQVGQIYGTDVEPNPQAGRIYSDEGLSPTLDSMRGGNRQPKIPCTIPDDEKIRIRKLTPKECFRLQGFPDEYFERAASVCSDSQLYKQAGNSVTVNVIYEIAKRL